MLIGLRSADVSPGLTSRRSEGLKSVRVQMRSSSFCSRFPSSPHRREGVGDPAGVKGQEMET